MLSLAKHELFRNNFYSKPSFGWNILRIAELIIEPLPNYLVITNNHPSYHTRGHDFTFSPKILPTSQCCCYQYLKINVSNREDFMYGPLGIRYVGYWYKEERERGRNVWLWTCDEMSVNNNIFGIWILTIYYSKFLTGFISLILGSAKLFLKVIYHQILFSQLLQTSWRNAFHLITLFVLNFLSSTCPNTPNCWCLLAHAQPTTTLLLQIIFSCYFFYKQARHGQGKIHLLHLDSKFSFFPFLFQFWSKNW